MRSSITPLVVPSISPYNGLFAGELAIRTHSNRDWEVCVVFGYGDLGVGRDWKRNVSSGGDSRVLPIRHHSSKYSHGGLMAQYDPPSHHSRCPQSRPTTDYLQGNWPFAPTATGSGCASNPPSRIRSYTRRIDGTTRPSITPPILHTAKVIRS